MTKYARRKREKVYLAWIRRQRCVCCGTHNQIQAAHVGKHSAFRKCSDLETIPLCAKHHLWEGGKDSHHRLGSRFWTHWQLDREQLIAELQARFLASRPRTSDNWEQVA